MATTEENSVLAAGYSAHIIRITAAYTATMSDHTIEVDTTSGAFSLTLPALSDAYGAEDADEGNGKLYKVVLVTDGGDLSIVEATADGAATVATLNDANDSVEIQATSTTTWRVLKPAALAATDIADDAVTTAKIDDAAVTTAKIDDDAVTAAKLAISIPITIAMPFTLGNRSGVNSDGVMIGALPHTAIGDANHEDNSATTFVDETTDINSAGAGDVTVPEPMDTNDALYIGYAGTFCAVVIDMGTAGAGDAVESETVWEYSQGGGTWATLESGHELTDSSTALTAGTATYVVSFVPPSDWANQAVDGGTAMRHVRLRATADDVYNTTTPLITQAWVVPLNVGDGITCPVTGTVSAVDLQAITASDTNDDTELLLVNITQGAFEQLTWTGGDVMDRVAGLSLAVTAADELAIVVIQEDGTTEFANGQAVLQLDI